MMVNDNIWLVVDLPLWKMMEWKSVGMIFHSQLNGKSSNSCSKTPTSNGLKSKNKMVSQISSPWCWNMHTYKTGSFCVNVGVHINPHHGSHLGFTVLRWYRHTWHADFFSHKLGHRTLTKTWNILPSGYLMLFNMESHLL